MGGHDCGTGRSGLLSKGCVCAGLEHVVNYDFPSRLEVYIHRVGRTGRQGTPGHAYSFFGRHLAALAPSLVRLLEGSGQVVDPNLRALLPAGRSSERTHRSGKCIQTRPQCLIPVWWLECMERRCQGLWQRDGVRPRQ